jgi:hypothetical protein
MNLFLMNRNQNEAIVFAIYILNTPLILVTLFCGRTE